MQSSSAQPRAGQNSPPQSPTDTDRNRKRKRTSRSTPTPITAATATSTSADKSTTSGRQPTIQGLLSTQQIQPRVGHQSPNNKRSRQEQLSATPPHNSSSSFSQSLPAGAMYSFPSKYDNKKPATVDLTKSPRARRPSTVGGGYAIQSNFNPHAGAKKLLVKNLKPQSAWDANKYFDQTWKQLDAALTTILSNEPLNFSMEDMYRGVENLCRQGRARDVYQKLAQTCSSHINDTVRTALLSKARQSNVETLQDVLVAWSSWNAQVITIRCIFYYMDRSYLLQSSKSSLQDIAVNMFRDGVFNNETLKPRIIDGGCDLIAADRAEQQSDRSILRQAIDMFHDLATYTNSFEPRMLAFSQTYVMQWAEQKSTEPVPDYVKAASDLMSREVERCDLNSLDLSTRRDLLALLEDHLIEKKVDYLTDQDAIADLLDTYAKDDLEKLYNLLQRKRMGARIRPAFEDWIELTGKDIIFDEKAQEEMVVRLLGMKSRLDTIWRTSFHRDEQLGHAMRESFEKFINTTKKGANTWGTDNSKPGEMIAKYVDQLLRGGSKAIPARLTADRRESLAANDVEDNEDHMDEDSEVNSQLDQVLDLFRFVHGKAVFEAFYKKDLARRLLMGRSASADAERSMLARLKTECGAGFTQNLEQMFKDVELAREEMSSYKSRMEERRLEKGTDKPLDLSVNVLSAAAWPTYPDVPVRVPPHIKSAIDSFEQHYKSKHSGRKLEWKHALAHCQMKATFAKQSKELVVSSFQAIVLLLFNSLGKDEHLTYDFIRSESGLPEAEVNRTLQSLACARLRPLTKHPKGKDINPTDTFTVNTGFTHDKYRIKINQVQLKETKEENKETHERVAADRNFECQAAVVRIMKSRKTIGHSELIAEVIKATRSRGVLDVKDIKKNIDRLIEKDYMEREEGNTYSYIA
ncbi:hypothetical protein AAFC00_003404 [Neodothiora populina]|uniref:Cullin family profile domain-containing protein n=1 Tax=Neodothiora populina TaxID=2781224 RepID=A0ABR3PE44_9PEZI